MHIKVLDCEDLFAQLAGHKIWIENPTWSQIEDSIDELDGNGHSIVVLQKEINFLDGEYMTIGGGGSDHRYICFIRTPEPTQLDWQLINPSQSESKTTKILASEFVELSLRDCVSYTDILQAAETFAYKGTRDTSVDWLQVELKTKFHWLEPKKLFDEENSDGSSQPETTQEQNEPENTESKDLAELQQELKSHQQKLTELRLQLKKVEERIDFARRTNIFGRKQSGENERQRDKLTQEIKDTKNRIALDESAIKALEE